MCSKSTTRESTNLSFYKTFIIYNQRWQTKSIFSYFEKSIIIILNPQFWVRILPLLLKIYLYLILHPLTESKIRRFFNVLPSKSIIHTWSERSLFLSQLLSSLHLARNSFSLSLHLFFLRAILTQIKVHNIRTLKVSK